MVFDAKMEDFIRKAHLVTGGHTTNALNVITYSSIVTRETVHIALTMVVLHNLVVKAEDVLNIYVMALNREKIWAVLGSEVGDYAGKSSMIVRALHSLKSVGASFGGSATYHGLPEAHA